MSFKFVAGAQPISTAGDIDAITSDDLGSVFIGQTVGDSFALANTGVSAADYNITVSGENTSLTDQVELSTDNGLTWSDSVDLENLLANSISDTIKYRFNALAGVPTTSGTFYFRAEES